MTPIPTDEQIAAFHEVYCGTTRNDIKLDMPKLLYWQAWVVNGWTADDLRLVVRYLQKHFYHPDKPQILRSMMGFFRLLEPSNFEQLLSDAKAVLRNAKKPPTERQKALMDTYRPAEHGELQKPPVIAGDVAKDLTGDYQALRKAAGL